MPFNTFPNQSVTQDQNIINMCQYMFIYITDTMYGLSKIQNTCNWGNKWLMEVITINYSEKVIISLCLFYLHRTVMRPRVCLADFTVFIIVKPNYQTNFKVC